MIRKTSTRRWASFTSGALLAGALVAAPSLAGLNAASAAPAELDYSCTVVTPLGSLDADAVVEFEVTAPESVEPGADVPVDITGTIDLSALSFPIPVSSITGDWDFPLSVGGELTTVNLTGSPWTGQGPVVFTVSGHKTLKAPTTEGTAPISLGTITGHLTALGLSLTAPCTPDAGQSLEVGSVTVASDPGPDPDPDPVAVPVTGTVALTGTPKVGKTLTAVPGTTDGATVSYQWLSNGTAINKATKPTLKLSKALKGKKVSVTVTYSKTDFLDVVQTSKAVKVKK